MAISDIPDNSERHRGGTGGVVEGVDRAVRRLKKNEPNANNFNSTANTKINEGSVTETTLAMNNLDYGWLEPRAHDPIITDTNLAEIDFEDFRNEDLAYAFSCGVSCLSTFC